METNRYKELRIDAGLTQKELAEEAGLTQSDISKAEKYGYTSPRNNELYANYFNVPLDYLAKRTISISADPNFRKMADKTGLDDKSIRVLKESSETFKFLTNWIIQDLFLSMLDDELNSYYSRIITQKIVTEDIFSHKKETLDDSTMQIEAISILYNSASGILDTLIEQILHSEHNPYICKHSSILLDNAEKAYALKYYNDKPLLSEMKRFIRKSRTKVSHGEYITVNDILETEKELIKKYYPNNQITLMDLGIM